LAVAAVGVALNFASHAASWKLGQYISLAVTGVGVLVGIGVVIVGVVDVILRVWDGRNGS
jgi:uncharacterized oligopeptide transporter (OPT) family protein